VRFDRIPGHDPQGPYWQGYEWSLWYPFPDIAQGAGLRCVEEVDSDKGFRTDAALYRFRIKRRVALLYIGQTGKTPAVRSTNHYRGMRIAAHELRYPPGRPLPAFYNRLAEFRDEQLEVEASWTSLAGLDKQDRLGIEAELIAAYRAVMGANPLCQFLDHEDDYEI